MLETILHLKTSTIDVKYTVFDFDQDIYGKEVIVQFISYLRGEVKFNNLQDLIDQMKVDEEQALAILANAQ